MYLPNSRGMGDTCGAGSVLAPASGVCVPAPDATDVSVSACSPDLCFSWAAPWIGRRSDLGMIAGKDCKCVPLVDLPKPWGLVVTGVIGALLAFKLAGGGR